MPDTATPGPAEALVDRFLSGDTSAGTTGPASALVEEFLAGRHKPKWVPSENPAAPPMEAGEFLRHSLRTETPWRAVEPKLRAAGIDPEEHRQDYQLAEAEAVQKGEGYGRGTGLTRTITGTQEAFVRRFMPFGFAVDASGTKKYAEAQKRFNENKATPEDIQWIARYRRLEAIKAEQDKTLAGQVVGIAGGLSQLGAETAAGGAALGQLARVPRLGAVPRALGFGEAAVVPATRGGAFAQYLGQRAALTATAPSFFVEQARQNNVAAGREPDDLRGYPTPILMGYANNLVLGGLGKIGSKVPTLAGRQLARGAAGTAEMGAVDALGGLADEFLPDTYKTHTKYGTLGKLLGIRQPRDIAGGLQDATANTIAMALVAGLHDGPKRAEEVRSKALDIIGKSKTPEEAAAGLERYVRVVGFTVDRKTGERRPIEGRLDLGAEPQNGNIAADAGTNVLPAAPEGGTPPRAPGSPLALPAARGGETPAQVAERPPESARGPISLPGGPVHEALRAAFGEGVEHLGEGNYAVALGGDRMLAVTPGEGGRVNLDFDFAAPREGSITAPVGKGITAGTKDLMTGLRSAVGELGKRGVGVEFTAEPRRAGFYSRALKAAGFEPAGPPEAVGTGNLQKFRWDAPAPKPAGPPALPAHKPTLAERFKAGGQNAVVVQGGSLGAPKPKGVVGPEPPPAQPGRSLESHLRGKIDESTSLTTVERERLHAVIDRTNEAVGKAQGKSKNAINKSTLSGFKKLQEEFPEEFGGYKDFPDMVKAIAADNARQRGGAKPEPGVEAAGPPSPVQARLDRADRVLQILTDILDREDARGRAAGRPDAHPERVAIIQRAFEAANRAHEAGTGLSAKEARGILARVRGELAAHAKAAARVGRPKKQDKSEFTLQTVRGLGGIDPKSHAFLAHYGSLKEALQDGIPLAAFRRGGMGLDVLAGEMHARGELLSNDPHELLQRLKGNRPTLAADTEASVGQKYNEWVAKQEAEQKAAAEDAAREAEAERQAIQSENAAGGQSAFDFFDSLPTQEPAAEARRFGGGPRGRPGKITLPSLRGSRLHEWLKAVRDEWAKMAGVMFPAIRRKAKALADAAARLVSAPAFAHAQTRYVMRAVFGDLKPEYRAKFYTAHLESRLRYMGSPTTLIGPDSPIKDNAEFQRITSSLAFKKYLQRWKAVMVPTMEAHFRDAQGLGPTDPILSATQLPHFPINFVPVSGDPAKFGPTVVRTGKGRLENVKHGRFRFAREAKGTATGYETDPAKAIEAVLAHGAKAAAKAELYRTAEREGRGVWGRPGQDVKLPDGTETTAFRDVDPPPGVQRARPGENTFYVDKDLAGEFRDALQTDRPYSLGPVTPLLRGVTRAALVSTVEAAYHSANLFASVMRPRVFRHTVKNLVMAVWNKGLTDAQHAQLADLARIGATKERGFDTGLLLPERLSKYDPTAWASKFLDGVDNLMRLSMDDAFKILARDGIAEDTTANRRDFLNTLGQYKRAAQGKIVTILRDTGVGPFAVAGTNSTVQAIRSLFFSSGLTATSPAMQARLRAHTLAKLGAAFGATALLNYILWGRADGDDAVPLGGLKVFERSGRSYFVDVGRLTGFSRGLRAVGLSALLEGGRRGSSTPAVVHSAAEDVTHSFLHPMMGPGVGFGYTAYSGKNTLGVDVAGKAGPGGVQEYENLMAALKNVNPSLAQLAGWDRAPKKTQEPPDVGERTLRLAEPYLKSRKTISAEQLRGLEESRLRRR